MSIETALFVAVLLLVGNAYFVAAEFAVVSVRRSAIELKVLEGSRAARATLGGMENLSVLLAAAQLGVTLCSLGLGALGEPAVAAMLEGPFAGLGMPETWLHPVAFVLSLSLVVFLHVLLGEMVPKNLALAGPERTALLLTPPLLVVVKVLRPLVLGLNAVANLTLRLAGIEPKSEIASTYSRDEVADLVEESHREGLLSEEEEHLLHDALQFDQRTIKSAYVPLKTVVTVGPDATPAGIEKLAATTGFSRFPVMAGGALDGYVHLKDVLEADETRRLKPIKPAQIRPLVKVSQQQPLRQVLKAMQKSQSHLVAVVDSRQRTLGVVTMEDVLEELIGELEVPVPAAARK